MADAVIRRDGDGVCCAHRTLGHWELVIGHAIQISPDPFMNNLS